MSAKGKYHDNFRGDSGKSSLLEHEGTRNAYKGKHITVSCTAEASPLSLLYPGVYNGRNHYIHNTPCTWELNFGLDMVRKRNWVFIVQKKPQKKGSQQWSWGKCLHFFFSSEITLSDNFICYLTQGAMVHSSLYMCYKMCCVNGGHPLSEFVVPPDTGWLQGRAMWAPAAGTGHGQLRLPRL